MKINRQDSKEKNNITAPWLYEFAHDLEKGAYNNVDYLKDYFDSRKKEKSFNTIDEKMADIKERVGFDLARKISEEINKDDKLVAANTTESLKNIKTAEYKHEEKDIKLMANILKYVKDMIHHESDLNRAVILARCRDEHDLGFERLRINLEKFSKWIDEQLEDTKELELISYIPSEQTSSETDVKDWEAEYYRHSKPES